MKRFFIICSALLVLSVLAAMVTDVSAQLKVKTIGRSLNSMTAPVRGATAPPWNYSTGLRAVGAQTRVYFKVDTVGSRRTGNPTWTLVSKPTASVAVLDSAAGNFINSVKVDLVGEYVVSATLVDTTAYDTVFASTYFGITPDAQAGCFCHPNAATIKASWENSAHATLFKRGITGNVDVSRGVGQYAPACVRCHTSGWDNNANNNNFGHQVKQTGWDTSWYGGLPRFGNYYLINQNDTSKWNMLTASQKNSASVGCEVCHGPMTDHKLTADKKKAGLTIKGDVCNQCHDGSRRYSLGTYYEQSAHYKVPLATATGSGRATCQPCHTGAGFLYYTRNAPTSYDTIGLGARWNLSRDATTEISCQACHDPHGNNNPYQLRTIRLDSLRNGYRIPEAFNNNPGMVCSHCHSARYSVKVRVTTTPPYFGFTDRFGPHYNVQADMLYGSNGYQYLDETFTGSNTHGALEGGCVTCHMQDRKSRLDGSNNAVANHAFSMTDTLHATGVWKPVDGCKSCHGTINNFDDIRAFYDFDRNGIIEGVQTEIRSLLNLLKARLPLDPLTGEPVTMRKDSLAVKNRPDLIQGIWNYYFVKYDKSSGVHNTKYAVRLLYKALGWTPLEVKSLPGMPEAFALNQNYPNPFNPTTNIRFSLPSDQRVTLQVFDVTGALVKTILDEAISAGNREIAWDGTNSSGAKVASGIYLYRMQAGNFVTAKKMVLMK